MIEVYHFSPDYPPMVSWSIRDAIVNETRDYMGLYWAGIQPPNFPVPAIRYRQGEKPWHNKVHALNHGLWALYWYLMDLK